MPVMAKIASALARVFSRARDGAVPAPGGSGTTRYLREDGTWVAPSGVSTPVAIADGGTGETTAAAAREALLPNGGDDGEILVRISGAWTFLTPGSTGDVLTINGSGVPEWTPP